MAVSYSIWAQPTGAIEKSLQDEIDFLADAYDGPGFRPHVTVAVFQAENEAEALHLTQKLASTLQSYHISFKEVAYGSIYYQCIFLLANQEQDTMRAGQGARELCGLSDTAYMPHLSLFYSDIDEKARQKLVELETSRLDTIAIPKQQLLEGFDVTSLHLWRTPADKTCKLWQHVAEIPLHGS